MFYIYLIRSTDPLHVYQFQRDFQKLYAIFKFFCDQKIDCNVALDEIEKLYYDYPGSEFVRKGRKNDNFSLEKVLKHLTENLATNKKWPFYGFTIIISLGPGEQYSERYNVLEVFIVIKILCRIDWKTLLIKTSGQGSKNHHHCLSLL
jgi:hypothetical protein